MSDFASAGMLRLIALGLQRQGIKPPTLPVTSTAHVALPTKRALATKLWHEYGPEVLLRIGEAVHDEVGEVAPLQALLLARDPLDLVQRWQRLERFVHSRHRVRMLASEPGLLSLQHASLQAAEPPSSAEDLLIFGLLLALAQRIGVAGLRARLAGDEGWRWQGGQWLSSQAPWPADCSQWLITWNPAASKAAMPAVQAPADGLQRLSRTLAADPGRAWTVALLAAELGSGSARSLQRRLAASGQRFGALLADARLASAAQMLTKSEAAPAEIGYACGYCDQAHFTREFKRRTALTPAVYRAQFRV